MSSRENMQVNRRIISPKRKRVQSNVMNIDKVYIGIDGERERKYPLSYACILLSSAFEVYLRTSYSVPIFGKVPISILVHDTLPLYWNGIL